MSLLCSLIPSAFFQSFFSRGSISHRYHSLFAYSLQVHGHTRHISPLFHWCIPNNSWMRPGYYQPLFIILQLRSNISSGANMATFDNIFILRHVFYRLFIPHVLFGAILPDAGRGGFPRENRPFCLDDHVWGHLHDGRSTLCQCPFPRKLPLLYDGLRLGTAQ